MEEHNGKVGIDISSAEKAQSCDKRSFCRINREMLPYKMNFFLLIGGMYNSTYVIK